MRASVRDVCLFKLTILSTILIGISDAQVSVEASFDDPRCNGQMVCPNDPLVFTCTVTGSVASLATVRLSPGVEVDVRGTNTTMGEDTLPTGVTVQSFSATMDSPRDFVLTLAITEASILTDAVECDSNLADAVDEAECQIATDSPGPPEGLSQDASANTETSVVVEWRSPATTGGSGINISEYRVTIDGQVSQTVSHDDSRDVFTVTITVPQYNTTYSVSVTAINSCGLSSQPATTDVSIEARPPPPRELSIAMDCRVLLDDNRPVTINWTNGEEEQGVVYPGGESVAVELTSPMGTVVTVCSDGNNCSTNISESGEYTVSLNVTNGVGSFTSTMSFSSQILYSEETLDTIPGTVALTVNRFCNTVGRSFQLSVRFGVTTDPGNSCLFMENGSRKGNVFSTTISPGPGESYCYMASISIDGRTVASLSGSGDTTPTEPPTEPNPPNTGLIVGVVIGVLVIAGAVVFIMIVIYVVKRQKNKDKHDHNPTDQAIPLSVTPSSPPPDDEESGRMYQQPSSIARSAHPETGELYTEISKPKKNEQGIEHQKGPEGDVYAMPKKLEKKGKKGKKKGNEVEPAEQEEEGAEDLTDEDKAAMYSVPDKKKQKAAAARINYADLALPSGDKPAPHSQGSYYADIKHID